MCPHQRSARTERLLNRSCFRKKRNYILIVLFLSLLKGSSLKCWCFCLHRGCFLTSSLIGTLALSLTIPLSVLADICMQKVIFTHRCFGFSPVFVNEAGTRLLSLGAFLLAVFCRSRSRLPLILHRHALVPLQQLGSGPGGAAESIRLY